MRLPSPKKQIRVGILVATLHNSFFLEYFSIFLEKLLAKWEHFRYNGSAWSKAMTFITPHTR